MTGTHGSPAERLWRRVTKSEDCWTWGGTKYPSGYGSIKVARKMVATHRLSWIITNGAIPDGLHVLHKCDNPPCVRPDHLFLGTNAANVRDKISKGRLHYYGGRPPKKLSEAQLNEARELVRAGVLQREVAKIFNVTQATISRNLSGKTSR